MNWKTFASFLSLPWKRPWILSFSCSLRSLMNTKFSTSDLYPLITPFCSILQSFFLHYDKFPKQCSLFKVYIIFKSLWRPRGGRGGFDEKFYVTLQRLCKTSSHRCDVMGNFNFPSLVLWNIWQRHRHAPFLTLILALNKRRLKLTAAKKQHHNLNWLFVYSPKRLK